MSSIELMEPKMDPGFSNREKLLKRENMTKEIISRVFSSDESCRIADILIGQLKLWMEGHIYIQTVHASLFMIERHMLLNTELRCFCETLMSFCTAVRAFITPTGVCDEEDFLGFMFGFEKECGRPSTPQVVDPQLLVRFQFIEQLRNLITIPCEPLTTIESSIVQLRSLCSTLLEVQPLPDSHHSEIIETSSDPYYHRSLLPPGPPRVVPVVSTSESIYTHWSEIFQGLLTCVKFLDLDHVLSDPTLSPFILFNRLRSLRDSSVFQFPLIRAFIFHRVYYTVDFPHLVPHLLGDSTVRLLGKNLDKKEVDLFVTDFASVLGRIVHTLHRSTSRQHRSLKHVLADLSVLQQVAWDMHTRIPLGKNASGVSKCLWSLVALIGCSLVQDNLLLNFRLNLVDWSTAEPALLFFLIETLTSVKLFVLNEVMATKSVSPTFLRELRNETIVTAIEHSASQALHDLLRERIEVVSSEELSRLFELRTVPLRAFIIPKSVGIEDFVKFSKFGSCNFQCLDESLSWIDRAMKEIPSDRIDGSLICRNVIGIKKALLTNKMSLIKSGNNEKIENKFHLIVPNLASG